jgi:murein DD-endopeptidase MepM/ murein hydrolase activator NlpD
MRYHRLYRMAVTIGIPFFLAVFALGTVQPAVSALDSTIITEDNFLSADPGFSGEKISQLFQKIDSPFASYSEQISGQTYTAGDVFWMGSQGMDYGISPKVLLSIFAFENRLISAPETRLMPAVQSLTQSLVADYKAYEAGERTITLANGSTPNVGQTNPASFALARHFAPSANSEFDLQIILGRWQAKYNNLFSVFPQELGVAAQSSPDVAPFLRLPFDQPTDSFLAINSFFDHYNHPTTNDPNPGSIKRFDGASISAATFDVCTLGVNCYVGHNGLDYSTGAGRAVLAAASGTVIYYYYNTNSSAGNIDSGLIIDHGNGYQTAYWHMDPISVRMGDTITKGQVVGLSGNIGRSSGAHLHFGVKTNNTKWIDPYGWWSTTSTTDPWGDSRWLFGSGLIANDREASMQFFYRSYWSHDSAGYGNGSTYTLNVNSAASSTNWAIWSTYLETAGNYEVLAYFPKKTDSTSSAQYRVFYSSGSKVVTINQVNSGDAWVSLGTFAFNHGSAAVILNDYTNTTESGKKVYFDAIKWQPWNSSPPTDIQISASNVAENVPTGTTVGTLTAVDPDAGDSSAFSLVSGTGSTDNNDFSISGSKLLTAGALDYETKNSYSIRVRATDVAEKTFEKVFTISVTNANDSPTGLTLNNLSIAENSASGTAIGTFSATDQDSSETFTYSLVSGTGSDNNSSFSISGTTLKSGGVFDYETQKTYKIRVRVADHGGLYYEKALSISVTNVNEAPTNLTLSSTTIREAQPAAAQVGALTTVDPDSANTFSYSLVPGSGSTDNSSFAITANVLSTAAVLDYESKTIYAIRIRSTDQGGLYIEKAITIAVTPQNEFFPVDLALSGDHIAENQPAGAPIGTLSTTDADLGDSFAYALVSGAGSDDNAMFTIDAATLVTAQPFDFESRDQLSIRVRTIDSGGLTFEKIFMISVTDVDEAPTDLLLDPAAIAEAQPNGTTVGELSLVDPDAGSTGAFSLISGAGSTDNASFTIQGSSLNTAKALDYETKQSLSIRVRGTDQGGLSIEKVFTIQVLPVNEYAPIALNLSAASIPENSSMDSTIGTLSTQDADLSDSHFYELVGGDGSEDNACFAVDADHLLVNCLLDYEQKNVRSIRVRVTDSGGLTFERVFLITLIDRQESLFPLVFQ